MRRILLLAVLSSGCYSVKYRFPDHEYEASAERHALIVSNFFWGLYTPVSIDPESYCPHGVRKMKSNVDLFGIVAQAITVGIWTPMKVKIECSAGPQLQGMPLEPALPPLARPAPGLGGGPQ